MVAAQIRSRDIIDTAVIKAMEDIPREIFIPHKHRRLAYADQALPIGNNQTISQPYVVAFMTQALQLKPGMKVLEIGTGSGYQTAILSRIADDVYTIEYIQSIYEKAKKNLAILKIRNVHFKKADGRLGWTKYAPYERIIVTAASEDVPPMLTDQLAENGKMVIPIGRQNWSQNLVLIHKKTRRFTKEKILPVRFVPLVKSKKE